MTKITTSFLTLVLIIVFSSIVYIWQAEDEKDALVQQISSQQAEIESLKDEISDNSKTVTEDNGQVQGATTITGEVSGVVSILNRAETQETVVCALEVYTEQEYCTNLTEKTKQSDFNYTFDIPLGTYEIYLINPANQEKVYYSEIQTCDEDENCFSDPQQKRLIKVLEEESQTDIDISI
jgi:hypothetical protein